MPDPLSGRTELRRGRPARISRDQILSQALRIVDTDGLHQLTMRHLGAQLGVDPMTIYHHVPDKAALFDGLVERIYSEVPHPPRTGEWDVDLRALAQSLRETFLAHPNAMPLLGTRPPITPPAFTLVEAATEILLNAGFPEQVAADGIDCAGRLVVGHVITESGRPPDGVSGGETEHRDAERTLPEPLYPSLVAIALAGVEPDPDRLFSFGLDGLILALQARLRPN